MTAVRLPGAFVFRSLPAVLPGFVLAHAAVIAGALLIGAGATFLSPQSLGYLGVVPIALGVWELWKLNKNSTLDRTSSRSANSFVGAARDISGFEHGHVCPAFGDLADSRQESDHHALFGAFMAVAFLLGLAWYYRTSWPATAVSAASSNAFRHLL